MSGQEKRSIIRPENRQQRKSAVIGARHYFHRDYARYHYQLDWRLYTTSIRVLLHCILPDVCTCAALEDIIHLARVVPRHCIAFYGYASIRYHYWVLTFDSIRRVLRATGYGYIITHTLSSIHLYHVHT